MANQVHPRLLAHLGKVGVYPPTCAIEEATEGTNGDGEIIKTWSTLAGHAEIRCRVAPAGAGEEETPDQSYLKATHRIGLMGYYPSITEVMRVVVGSAIYDIERVEHDGGADAPRSTYLMVEQVR